MVRAAVWTPDISKAAAKPVTTSAMAYILAPTTNNTIIFVDLAGVSGFQCAPA